MDDSEGYAAALLVLREAGEDAECMFRMSGLALNRGGTGVQSDYRFSIQDRGDATARRLADLPLYMPAGVPEPDVRIIRRASELADEQPFAFRVDAVRAHPNPRQCHAFHVDITGVMTRAADSGSRSPEAIFRGIETGRPPPSYRIVIGITDICSDRPGDVGFGVDEMLNALAADGWRGNGLAAGVPIRVAIAVTGLERIFALFDVSRTERRWYGHRTARSAAFDPRVVLGLLRDALMDRPHLRNLAFNLAAQPQSSGVQFVGFFPVMPFGFFNYGPANWDRQRERPHAWAAPDGTGYIGEHDLVYLTPMGCADPILAAAAMAPSSFALQVKDLDPPAGMAA